MPEAGRATSAEYALWASGAFVTHVDAWIERVEGGVTVFQSYRSFAGWDWIRSLNLSVSGVDIPIGSGTLVLHRQRGAANLSPLMTASSLNQDGGSYAPAIEFGREIVIRTADTPTLGYVTLTSAAVVGATSLAVSALARGVGTGSILHFPQGQVRVTANASASATTVQVSALPAAIPSGTKAKISHEPMAADWKVVFIGVTDDPEWGGKDSDKVSVPFRDRNGTLADTYVRAAKIYGSEGGTPLLDVAQNIVDDWMGADQYVLVATPTPPAFQVTHYEVTELSVWEALEKLGDQVGAVFRQKWSPAADDYRTTLVTPPRDKVIPDYEVPPSTYLDVQHISTGSTNLRTIVRVYAVEAGTGAELVYQKPAEDVLATDPKVLQYGPRYLQLSEEATSAIDTQAELVAFGNAIYADVSSPPIPLEIETKYCWFAAPDQLVRWKANGKLWDEDQDSAVLSVSHDFPSPGIARTQWKTAGKPKGRYASWMNQGVAIAGRQAKPPAETTAKLIDVLPRQRLADGSVEFGFIRGPGTKEVWSGSLTFLGPETEEMWEQVRDAVSPNPGTTFVLPAAQEGYVTLGQIEAISPAGTVGEVWRTRLTGTTAPASFLVNFDESADGLTSTINVLVYDPRGITLTPLAYVTQPGVAESAGVAMTAGLPGVWSYTVNLHPQHNVGLRVEVPRNDGGEAFKLGPYTLDRNKVPALPDVREVRELYSDQVVLEVDSPDSDTASLWYREETGVGILGAETSVPPRAGDVRFGSYTITIAAVERVFRVYAKNAAGLAGEYRRVRVTPRVFSPIDTRYTEVRLKILSSDATTVTVEGTTGSSGGTIQLVAVTGSASRLSGPVAGVASASGTQWVFTRGAINAGAGQAEFRGEASGYESDSDFITIEEQGRDTVPLLMRAIVTATTPTTVTVRVAVADPYPAADISVVYTATGVGTVTPASPATYPAANVTALLDTTKYVDFTVARAATGGGTGRITFTASRSGRLADSDAVDVPAVDAAIPTYTQCFARVTASDATTVTVQATATPAGAQVTLAGTTGTAVRTSGPAVGVASASGTTWVFSRGAINSGAGQAEFTSSGSGLVSDTDLIAIEEQGRDTVPLLMRATVIASTASSITARVAVADPYPGGDISVTYSSIGVGTVSPAGTATYPSASITSVIGTTAYVDFTIPRGAFGTGMGRVTFTASRTGRLSDSDAVDVPSTDPVLPVYAECMARVTASDASTVTVQVTATPSGAQVALAATTGGAARVSGPAEGVLSASGTAWVFSRGAINSGAGQAEFTATGIGLVPDTDLVSIEEQGRDTVPLLMRATVVGTSSSNVVARVAVADPYPGGDISVSYTSAGVGAVSPASPSTYPAANITASLDTTKYVDFSIPRGVAGAGMGRITFTASRAGRLSDSDAVDVPSIDPNVPVYAECLATITASTATTVTVQVTGSAGTQVQWLSTGGSATYISGPAPLTPSPSGTSWVFGRGAFGGGMGQVVFLASGSGIVPDSDTVSVEEQGRDTVPLQIRARVLSTTATQAVVRVAVADPHPANNVVLTYASDGTGTVSPVSPRVLAYTLVTPDLDTTAYVDFTIPFGTRSGRVVFTATCADRTPDSDAVDTPSITSQNGISDVLSATAADDAGVAHITVIYDADTVSGTNVGQHKINGGSTLTHDIDANGVGHFDVTRSITASNTVEVRGKNDAGTYNPVWHSLQVNRYEPVPKMLFSLISAVVDEGSSSPLTITVSWQGLGLDDATQYVEIKTYRGAVLVASFTSEPEVLSTNFVDADGGIGSSAIYYSTAQLVRTSDDAALGPLMTSNERPSLYAPGP